MKTLLCALLFGGVCLAADEAPQHVRVSVQYIEVPHPALTGWLGEGETGAAIHAKAMALAESGEAKILHTSMIVCISGIKATVESVLEEIYPTETTPPELPGTFGPDYERVMGNAPNPMLRVITAYETKNTGMTLEIQPTVGETGQTVNLRLLPEYVRRLRLETMVEHKDEWGDGSLRMPTYEKWGTDTSLTLVSGKSELVSVITPEAQPPPPAVSRRVLLFVRADVIESR